MMTIFTRYHLLLNYNIKIFEQQSENNEHNLV